MKISTLAIAAMTALAYGCAHSGTTLRAAQWPPALIPQYNVDSVTHDSASNRMYALVGTVVDSASGRPIQGAVISLGPLQKPARWAYSDDRGGFVLGRVPPGHYQLLVRRIGYMPFSQARDARAGVVDTVRARLPVSNMTLQ
jgi:Carboxypeptidase regulatory-like domain